VDNFARAIKPAQRQSQAVVSRERPLAARALPVWTAGGSLGGRFGACFRRSPASSLPRQSLIHVETLVGGRDRRAGPVSFFDITKARLLILAANHSFLSP
jgi:hypothetical protein